MPRSACPNDRTLRKRYRALARFVSFVAAVILVGLGLVACGSREAAHSDYFIVTFLPGLPAPSDQGVEAIASAAREAGRHTPSFIEISAAQPADGAPSALTQQRLDAVQQALVRDGVDQRLVRTTFHAYPDKEFDARKDSFLLDLAFGVAP
jgi:hypothetical protein